MPPILPAYVTNSPVQISLDSILIGYFRADEGMNQFKFAICCVRSKQFDPNCFEIQFRKRLVHRYNRKAAKHLQLLF